MKGLTVLIGCRDEEKGRTAVEQLSKEGVSVELKVVNVNSADSIIQMMESVKNEHGRLDVLVNNAGIILDRGTSILNVQETVMKETFETNYFGQKEQILPFG